MGLFDKRWKKAPIGKAAGVDAIKSEMLKIDMETSTNLLFELWAACGRCGKTSSSMAQGTTSTIA